MTASTLSCGCDMPIPIYADWCQDQGWDADELRVGEEVVLCYSVYHFGNGHTSGEGYCFGVGAVFGKTGNCCDWLRGCSDDQIGCCCVKGDAR